MSVDHALAHTPADSRTLSVDRLRSAVTLLVLAHHSVLAYHPYAPPPAASFADPPRMWAAFPVVDTSKWAGIDVFVGFNEGFFMSLMFFIGGLFVWSGLKRKGAGGFFTDRLVRLGIPFVFASALLAPLAYFPSYLQSGGEGGLTGFISAWLALPVWNSGPAWFLWVLLGYAGVAALIHRIAPHWGDTSGARWGVWGERPIRFFLGLICVSALAYLPMAHAFGVMDWFQAGPFSVQSSRVLHYGVYFFVGAAIGAHGVDRGLLARDGRLARRWPLWVLAALLSFAVSIALFIAIITAYANGGPGIVLTTVGNFSYVVTCAACSLAMIAIFVRYARRRGPIGTALANNAYGMYLTHYPIVSGLQYALLGVALSGAVKGLMVFVVTACLTLALTALLRRSSRIARVI
jgi:Acyltransferase family